MTALRAAAVAIALALSVAGRGASAQGAPPIRIVDVGPGPSGRLLREVLAAPHVLVVADSGTVALRRDSVFATTVVVLGATATVASRVAGDVLVVGGDLFLHPGAEIAGRAIAIGGCVYNSTLATVRGSRVCFRDNTFAIARGPGGEMTLAYQELRADRPSRYSLPGFRGFLPPAYDRVNGLSLSWGPRIALAESRVTLDPRATYRSDLGVVDPSVEGRVQFARRLRAVVTAARGSYTNEAWIRSDLIHAVSSFAWGNDGRNFYRADRVDGRLTREIDTDAGTINVHVGGRWEDASSVNPDSTSLSAPFSFLRRRDRLNGMLRPNPQGTEGEIASAIVGANGLFAVGDLTARTVLTVETPFHAPGGARFVQTTFDGETNFAAFSTHRVHAGAHVVYTTGDPTPRQRYSYLGGAGTLQTEDLLGFGGDQLLFVDGVYVVPVDRIRLPLVGSPMVGLRYAAGSAGIRELPRFTQNVGVRLIVSLARVDFLVNPASGETALAFGVAALR